MPRPRSRDPELPVGIRRGRTPGTLEIRVSLPADPGTGKYRTKSKTIAGGVREAQKVRAQMLLDSEQQWGSEGSLTELLQRWLAAVEGDLSPNTTRNYRAYVRRYVQPHKIGGTPLRKLTAFDLDRFYNGMAATGLSPATVRQCHAILRKALGQAVKWGQIPANVAVNASPPKLRRKEIRPPTVDVIRAVLEEADRRDAQFGAFLRVAAYTGARRAEVCGLRWSDLAFSGRQLMIARSIVDTPTGLVAKGTKTDRPRTISLNPSLVDTLGRVLATANQRAVKSGTRLHPQAYVFSDDDNGQGPWRPDRLSLAFYRLCKQLGVQCRLHDLRHAHATELIGDQVDIRTVAGRLGHANPSTTLAIYSHFIAAKDVEAADRYGARLDGV